MTTSHASDISSYFIHFKSGFITSKIIKNVTCITTSFETLRMVFFGSIQNRNFCIEFLVSLVSFLPQVFYVDANNGISRNNQTS